MLQTKERPDPSSTHVCTTPSSFFLLQRAHLVARRCNQKSKAAGYKCKYDGRALTAVSSWLHLILEHLQGIRPPIAPPDRPVSRVESCWLMSRPGPPTKTCSCKQFPAEAICILKGLHCPVGVRPTEPGRRFLLPHVPDCAGRHSTQPSGLCSSFFAFELWEVPLFLYFVCSPCRR